MKMFLLTILLFMTGCTSKFYLEIYNNSDYTLIIYAIDEVTIEPGETKKVKIFTSTSEVKLSANGKLYEYALTIGTLPGEYMKLGLSHAVKLQVEPNLTLVF
jgi:hypothetical protein